MQADSGNFTKNEHKWMQIEGTRLEKNCKLKPVLNRRSYNEHKGSANFINLLVEDSCASERSSFERNIRLSSAVLHSSAHTNEEACRCFPSKELFERSAFCFEASLSNNMSADVASQSEFASQTLKPFSTQNLEWVALNDTCDCPNGNMNYKLKESSPGCLPSKKGKSRKLQRKDSHKTDREINDESVNNNNNSNKDINEDYVKCSDPNKLKVRRKSSFINSVIKLARFGRKKKRTSEETHETSDDSNGGTESSEEKRQGSSSYQDEEFIFGGVRVFFDENGEFCEVDQQDEYYDSQSVSTFSSDESECYGPTRRTTTKFESSDSLNLGYSGSFVT